MNRLLILLPLLLATSTLKAQDAYHSNLLTQLQTDYNITGNNWVFSDTEATTMAALSSYGTTETASTATGQAFTQKKNFQVTNAGPNSYNNAATINNLGAINAGDHLLLVFWAKGISGQSGGYGISRIVVETTGPPYEQQLNVINQQQNTWTQYLFPFESLSSYAAGEMHFAIQFGYENQEVELGGIALLNYGTTYTLEELPQKNFNDAYAGMESNATWRTAADARIEQNRKANLSLEVVDDQGNPIPTADLTLEMQCHEFAFGTAVSSHLFAGNDSHNPTYENKLINLDGKGHGFNMVVFENGLKWRGWEGNYPSTIAGKEIATNWLVDHNIQVRGHTLVWPGWQYMPDYMETNQNDPAFLLQQIDTHMQDILGNTTINTQVQEWDVVNEITTNRDIENALAGYSTYTTGREIYPELFDKTALLNPTAKRYINDYMAISSGGLNTAAYNRYKVFLTEIVNSTNNIDGIGFQAHINNFPVAPEKIYEILEDFHTTYNKEMKITEFDMTGVNPSIQEQYMRDFLTITFSHLGVNGFLMWGFWDGKHWYDEAPMYDENWNLKPGGQAFIDRVFNDWWSNETATTSPTGTAMIRAFKGKHLISVTKDGVTEFFPLVLGDDQTTQLVLGTGCPAPGTACDDNDPSTENDIEDGRCNCVGVPIPEDFCNLLENGDFDTNITNWDNWSSSVSPINGEAFIEITTPGANPWNVGFTQDPLPLVQGKSYTITYDARATVDRSINIKLGLSDAPYTGYLNRSDDLTTIMNSFTHSFTMTAATDLTAKFEFHLGEHLGNVYIDNVRLIENSCADRTFTDLTVLLEGCYNTNSNQHRSDLYDKQLLPGQANNLAGSLPYSQDPWNYAGTEAVNFDAPAYVAIESEHNAKIIDWLLVSFRTATDSASTIGKKAALLLENGKLVFPQAIDFLSNGSSYYVLVEHWSHMGALSAVPVTISAQLLRFDFSNRDAYHYGLGLGTKELSFGKWALYGGNCAQGNGFSGYDINGTDKVLWIEKNGAFNEYLPTDLNMDGDVTGDDRILWEQNNGVFGGN